MIGPATTNVQILRLIISQFIIHSNCLDTQHSPRPTYLGKATTSLKLSTPARYANNRSKPIPKPPCGAEPKRLRSAYHCKLRRDSLGERCGYGDSDGSEVEESMPWLRIAVMSSGRLCSRSEPPATSATEGKRRSKFWTVVVSSGLMLRCIAVEAIVVSRVLVYDGGEGAM